MQQDVSTILQVVSQGLQIVFLTVLLLGLLGFAIGAFFLGQAASEDRRREDSPGPPPAPSDNWFDHDELRRARVTQRRSLPLDDEEYLA